jgi:hypothetical protein
MMRIVGQLAEAIDVAPGAGVGHRALQPRDLLVTPDEARASGFGVVVALGRVGLRAPVRRPYSAPERIEGAEWSTPADVFSLGAIAFELLTGRRPSGTGDEIGPLTGAVVPNAEHIQEVLARAMHESPGARFATGLALANALASAGTSPAVPSVSEVSTASTGLVAFAEESGPETVIPSSPPAFAEEPEEPGEPEEATDADVSRAASDDDRAGLGRETGDHAWGADKSGDADRDERAGLWALTHEHEEAGGGSDYDAQEATHASHAAGTEKYQDLDAETPAEVVLTEARPTPRFGDEFRASASEREARLHLDPHVDEISEHAEEEPVPPQIVERDVRPLPAHEADDRVPFEHMLATPERARPPMLHGALMLIVGVLIGSTAVYFSGFRGPAPQAVASSETTSSPAANPQDKPAGTLGTATGAGEQPATPAAPPPLTASVPPRERAPSAAPPAARSGKLVVRSTPPGAAVTINGKWSGRTPLTKNALGFGDYTVRVLLPGYQTRNEQVNLSADAASRTLSVQLQREAAAPARPAVPPPAERPQPASPGAAAAKTAPAIPETTGVLEIDSRPVGARVFVDDRPVGTTPVRVPDVAPGSRVVRLELADHRPWTEVAQVSRGKTTRVAGSLEPIR